MTQLKDLQVGDAFEGLYLIKQADLRQTRAGKPFLAMIFQDRTGQIGGNLWDADDHMVETFTRGKVVYMRAIKELYQGSPQVNKIFLRLPENTEPNNPKDFKPKSPVNEQELRNISLKQFLKLRMPLGIGLCVIFLKNMTKSFSVSSR
jgi:3'-5' exoribonuclease